MLGRALRAWGLLLFAAVSCHKLAGDDYTIGGGSTDCIPGVHQCVGSVLQRCSNAGDAWENADVCASEALCSDVAGACLTALCQANQRRCQAAELQECAPTRDGWTPIDTCTTAAHCNATVGTCTTAPCMPGMVQCSGAELQECRADQTGWDVLDTCQTPALCAPDPGACDAPLCDAAAVQCDGAILQTCSDGRDAWNTIEQCESVALCDAAAGSCSTPGCSTPGVYRCSTTGALERCAADLTGWEAVDTCLSAGHCDSVNGRCNEAPCTTGSFQCSGAVLETCNADSTGWDLVETCATDGLCTSTLVAALTACAPPICDVGQFQCVDEQPQICNAGRTGFRDNGDACVTADLCDDVTGTCAEPACDVGETTCTGEQPEICNPGRTGFVANGDPCESVDLCNPDTGICGDAVCNVNQRTCGGTGDLELQRCNAAQTGWDVLDTCDTAELCSASLDGVTCEEPACDVDERQCTGAQPELCNTGRTAFVPDGNACPTVELCNNTLGTCDIAACDAGDTQCTGTGLQLCNAALNGYDPPCATCATTELCMASDDDDVGAACDAADCVAPACAVGETEVDCDGATLQVCNAGRTGFTDCGAACATAALCEFYADTGPDVGASCDATDCPPLCDVGETEMNCDGDTLQVCNAGRTGFTDCSAACATPELCEMAAGNDVGAACDATDCPAPICVLGETNCDGADLQMCNTGRTGWDDCDTCETTALCIDSDDDSITCDTDACDDPVCADAEVECMGDVLSVCNAGRNGWDPMTDCTMTGQVCVADMCETP